MDTGFSAPVSGKQPWAQLKSETGKAYEAFVIYLMMGDGRTAEAVARKLGKSGNLIHRWSSTHAWKERAAVYSEWRAKQQLEIEAISAQGKLSDWSARQKELRELEWEMAKRCIDAAKQLLDRLLVTNCYKLTPSDVARLLETAQKLGRLSTGMPTEHTEVTGAEGGPIKVEVSSALEKVYGRVIDIPEKGILPLTEQAEGDKIAPRPISGPANAILKSSQTPENEPVTP